MVSKRKKKGSIAQKYYMTKAEEGQLGKKLY